VGYYGHGLVSVSPPELLVLHAVRLKGMPDTDAIARRFSLDREIVENMLSDFETRGWVQRVEFADLSGWTLTDEGREENSRLLAAEGAETDSRAAIAATHSMFVPLNARLLTAMTNWQIRPTQWDPMAANDHTDWGWDERVLKDLASLLRSLQPVCEQLSATLDRMDGYTARLAAALDRVDQGERMWVDQPGIDSFHTIWFELHEDLLATLGMERGQEP